MRALYTKANTHTYRLIIAAPPSTSELKTKQKNNSLIKLFTNSLFFVFFSFFFHCRLLQCRECVRYVSLRAVFFVRVVVFLFIKKIKNLMLMTQVILFIMKLTQFRVFVPMYSHVTHPQIINQGLITVHHHQFYIGC